MNNIFYTDYGPLLSRVLKSAFLMYVYYDKIQNENGVVQVTYIDLNEHLGLANATIAKANALLKKLNLIAEVENSASKKYKLLPVKKLSSSLRKEVLKITKTEEYETKTELSKSLKLTVAQIVVAPPPKKKKKAQNPHARELTAHLYDHLKALGVTPKAKGWFTRNATTAQRILANITLDEAKGAIDWGFSDNWWKDKMTSLTVMDSLYDRYRLSTKTSIKLSRSTPIPDDIQAQIATIIETPIETYEDAAFLKQTVLDGDGDQDITKVVSILEKSGIVPAGEENLQFG